MDGLEWLARVLEASVKRNGEKGLTNAYLLNIIRMAQRVENAHQERVEKMLSDVLEADRQWGSD